jgi:NADH:ubiquinone oxidoreductase subunit 4 (subunit M)
VELGTNRRKINLDLLIRGTRVAVLFFFFFKNLFLIYIVFEISVIPIFIIILGSGYQPERGSAA